MQRVGDASDTSSVGAARSGFDPYSHAANEYGTIAPGENPARIVDVPQSTNGADRVSKVARTAMEAAVTPDSVVPELEREIMEGAFSYNPKTNEEVRQTAESWLKEFSSIDEALVEWNKTASSDSAKILGLSLQDYAKGIVLYSELLQNAVGAEDESFRRYYTRQATDVLGTLQRTATKVGQLVQINRLFKKLTPEARVVSLQKSVEKLNASLPEKLGVEQSIQIDETLLRQWVEAMNGGNQAMIDLAEQNIYHDIAEKVAKTPYGRREAFWARWDAWRYLCMLGNAKTIGRNTLGNVGMLPLKAARDKLGALMELGVDKSERTKYLGSIYATEEGRKMLQYAKEQYQADRDILLGTEKYADRSERSKLQAAIHERLARLPRGMRQAQEVTNFLMNNEIFGDGAFLRHHYTVSFAQAARARGLTAEQLRKKRGNEAQIDSLREYAIGQAMKATYRDVNAFSKVVKNLQFKGEGTGARIGNMIIGSYLPFKGTPANVLVRAIDYSPIGVIKGITETLVGIRQKAKNGASTISSTQIIEDLSAGLTGSAVFALGILLQQLGVLHGPNDGDDDRTGMQEYSINIGDTSISLDWLAPASIPLFAGVSLGEAWSDPHESAISAVFDTAGAMFDPLLEMSMLSGIQELLESLSYGGGDVTIENTLYTVFVQSFLSYLSQGIPTLSSQIARALDKNSEYTYTGDIQSSFVRRVVNSAAKVAKKIPFVNWRQYEYVDEWGRTESNGAWYERIFNNFLNPAYVSDVQITDVDAELDRLETVTGIDATPTRRGYTITVNKEKRRLSGEEYERYAKTYGEEALKMMTVLMASSYYAEMSDADRAAALEDILDVANEYGKHAALPEDYDPSAEDKLYNLTQTGLSIADAYAAKIMHKQLEADPDMTASLMSATFSNWVSGQAWTEKQKQAAMDAYGTFYTHIPANAAKYDALSGKIGEDSALAVAEAVARLTPSDGSPTVTEAQKVSAIAAMPLTDDQKWTAFSVYKTDWRMEYFRDAGINPSVYAAYLDAIPRYRLSSKGTKSSKWTTDTIYAWLDTTAYSSEIKQKVAQIATMKKPEEEDA